MELFLEPRWFLASCGEDKTIRLVLMEGYTRTVRTVSWSPYGKYLAIASFDGTEAVEDDKSGQFECWASLEGDENEVKCMVVATCSRDKSDWLWDVDYDG